MFDAKYIDWNQRRIKQIIDFYGHKFIYYKKILDLGCGHGDISGALFRLGADITAVDARPEHLKIAAKKYPGIKTVQGDLDNIWMFPNKKFDIILSLSILPHLRSVEKHIKEICQHSNHIVLDSAVSDSYDPLYCPTINENKGIYDLAYNGVGCRPSALMIERLLNENGFNFKRITNGRLNTKEFIYDWAETGDNTHSLGKRRFWFATSKESRIQIANKPEVREIPTLTQPSVVLTDYKPKVAVCISGYMRTYQETFSSVRRYLLDKYNCDVFIHTWDHIGSPIRGMDRNIHQQRTEDCRDKIERMFNPKKMVIEPLKHFPDPIVPKHLIELHRDVSGIQGMYYKIQAANQLKIDYENENNFKYDVVVRLRSDLLLESPVDLSGVKNSSAAFVPRYGDFSGTNDQFAWGSSETMDVYSSLFPRITEYVNAGCLLNPERLNKFNLDKNNVKVERPILKYVIKRSTGNYQDNFTLEKRFGFIR